MNENDGKIIDPVEGEGGNPTPPAGNNDWQAPEGFDADMFDENHALIPDKVKAKWDAEKANAENYKKQAEDMRRKVSNKDALGSEEEYAKGYKNEEFAKHIEAEGETGEFLKSTLGNVDKIAKENGLSLAQTNAIKDGLYELMQDLGVVDNSSDEQRAAKQLQLQQSVLGDKAAEIVKANVEWVKGYDVFSDKEKEMLELAATKGNPLINSVLRKIMILHGKANSSDLPISNVANNDGLPSDAVLAEEYVKASPERRQEIIQSRIKAGRKGGLPISSM